MNHFHSTARLLLAVALCFTVSIAIAQRRSRDENPSSKTLEIRAQKAEESLAKEYIYKLGDVEKARDFLIRLNDLRKGLPGVREKIDQLEEELMNANSDRLTLDVSKGWGEPVAQVAQGQAFRVVAAGDYKLTASLKLDVNGVPVKDPIRDMAGGIPFGALMGMVVGEDGKPDRPFAVKSGVEHTPKRSGKLYLRVNTPPEARCSGKITVQLSGKLQTAASGRKR